MQLRRLMGLLMASVSVSSLLLAGCTRQRNFDDEVRPTPLSSAIHAQRAKVQKQEHKAND